MAAIQPSPHTMFFGREIYQQQLAAAEALTRQQVEEAKEAAPSPEAEAIVAAAKQVQLEELAAEKRETLGEPAPVPTPAPTKLQLLNMRETELRTYLKGEVAALKGKAASYTAQEETLEQRMAQRRARMDEFQECRQKVLDEKDRLKAVLQLRDNEQDQDSLLKLETYDLKVMNGYTRMNREQIDDEMKMARIKEKKESLLKHEENYLKVHHEHRQILSELEAMQKQNLMREGQTQQPPTTPAEMADPKMEAAMLHLEKIQEQHRERVIEENAAKKQRLEETPSQIAEQRERLLRLQEERQQQFLEEQRAQLQREQQAEQEKLAEQRRKLEAQQKLQQQQFQDQQQREMMELQKRQERLQQQAQQQEKERAEQEEAEKLAQQEKRLADLRTAQLAEQKLQQQQAEQKQKEAEELRVRQQQAEQKQKQEEELRVRQQQQQEAEEQQAEQRQKAEADIARLQHRHMLRQKLAEEEERGRQLLAELARNQAVLKAEILAEDKKEKHIEQEYQQQEASRNASQRLLAELAEREKGWESTAEEEDSNRNQEPQSPASKRPRGAHTPRVVPPPPKVAAQTSLPMPFEPGRIESGLFPPAPVPPGPYHRQPDPLLATPTVQQAAEPALPVKPRPPFPPYLGIYFQYSLQFFFKVPLSHDFFFPI